MPLWEFYLSSPSLLSTADKQELAKKITNLYTAVGLPAFYVNVRFQEESSYFNGGEPHQKFVLIRIEHLARQFRDLEHKQTFLKKVDGVLNPVLKPLGADWEYGIQELDRDLWKINGIVPPLPGTDLEKKWVKLNRPVEE